MRVVAVVLAAGEGRRMGGPKALLSVRGTTFLDACLRALDRPGVSARVVVTGHQAERVAAAVTVPGVRIVHNIEFDQGMLSSVLRGLEAAQELDADALLIHPVDHPLVEPETVDRVVAALLAGALIAVPSHQGRRGHPGGFARAAWPELRSVPPDQGARALLHAHPEWIVHVEGGPGSVAGVNTPADLRRLR